MRTCKLRKIIGWILYNCFCQYLPVSFAKIGGKIGKYCRRFCARLMLDSCGKDVNVERKALFSTRITLGDRSGIGIGASIGGRVVIGNDVMMGPNCTIYTRNHRFDDITTTMRGQGFQEERPVTIEDDVWIGGHVIILPGVTIGHGAIVGAGAVVSKDVPPYAIAAGNPARVVKYRIKEEK